MVPEIERPEAQEVRRGIWSKVEGVAARIALVVACARYVLGETDREVVDEQDIAAGIAAACWFAREAERIRMQGGSIGISELRSKRRRYRIDDSAERALEEFVTSGLGYWGPTETTAQGGRPARRFFLSDDPGRV